MDNPPQFSSGLELATLIVTSDIPLRSWDAIKTLNGHHQSTSNATQASRFCVKYGIYEGPNCKIIAFSTSPTCRKEHLQGEEGDLVSSANLKLTFPVFDFLCSKGNKEFSINKASIYLFQSFYDDHITEIKRQIDNSPTPLIMTGHSLGGSIAALFTLWLLDYIDLSTRKRPLCVTFGSPLVGNAGLQKGILQYSSWNSSFFHIASIHDPLPTVVSPNIPLSGSDSRPGDYVPFGTFLLCSESGSSCYEEPRSIMELLTVTNSERVVDYERIVSCLKDNAILKMNTESVGSYMDPLRASYIVQLKATGLASAQNVNVNDLITRLEKNEKELVIWKKELFDPSKTLNDMKKFMAQMEWYKMVCKTKKLGYYDSYKNSQSESDIKVITLKKNLTLYWEQMVKVAEMMPQKEGSAFRTRWLFGGTNYRRMIEPLDIAEYYRKGLKDYENKKRLDHYKKLEQWIKDENKQAVGPTNARKQAISSLLTEDSCFWARVEEGRIACDVLKNGQSSSDEKGLARDELGKFEEYVMGMIKDYTVSPEIFLAYSSFMKWWNDYEGIMGSSYNSNLTDFMRRERYNEYADGSL